ncbi:MAG TPA: hypothetical protein VN922_02275 [Bacteroidia bacterium]|nr:hypothetical protein [Bacteroidia bacterium]
MKGHLVSPAWEFVTAAVNPKIVHVTIYRNFTHQHNIDHVLPKDQY